MIDIENSRPLDVHRWSSHSEVCALSNSLLDELFPLGFSNHHTRGIREKALRVMLLDLFCCWHEDQDMSLGISLAKTGYNRGKRYNKLGLTWSPIKLCFDALAEKGYIDVVMGDRRINRVTRMRATQLLIEKFQAAQWNIEHAKDKLPDEVIVVNISKGKELLEGYRYPKRIVDRDVDYRETARSEEMRSQLQAYNDFIRGFDFHILCNGTEFFSGPTLSSQMMQLHRVFSNKRLTKGGRFYGSFQNISKEWRLFITIDSAPTVEIDFSSMHPTLAYAKAGVDFYSTTGRDDIYMPDHYGYDKNTYEKYRGVVKILFNTLINAPSEASAASSMMRQVTENYEYQSHGKSKDLRIVFPQDITYAHIRRLIQWIKATHPAIADLFCHDLGRHFMYVDSQITNRILQKMVIANKPLLPVHDSYICKEEDQELLNRFISESYQEEMQVQGWTPVRFKTKVTNINL